MELPNFERIGGLNDNPWNENAGAGAGGAVLVRYGMVFRAR